MRKIGLALLLLVPFILVTAVTKWAVRLMTDNADFNAFRISFWSGLAYSGWVALTFSIATGISIWLFQEEFAQRAQRTQERDRMMVDAIHAINVLYDEFPLKPVIKLNSNGNQMPLFSFESSDPETGQAVFETNCENMANTRQCEYEAQIGRIISPRFSDKAVECIPIIAVRIYRRFSIVSLSIWENGSPLDDEPNLRAWTDHFMRSYRLLHGCAAELDYRLRYHVRWQNSTTATDTYRDEADRCFYLATILNADKDFMLDAFAPNDEDQQNALLERHQRLRKVANLERLVPPFVNSMSNVQNVLREFLEFPRKAPMDYRGYIPADPPWGFDERYYKR